MNIDPLESKSDGFGRTGRFGRSIVPNSNNYRAVFPARNQSGIGIEGEPFVAKIMQKLESGERGLGNSILGQQPEATVERFRYHTLFFENIGERPVGHHL